MDGDTQAFSVRPATQDDVAKLLEIEARIQVAPWTRENIEIELSKPYSSFLVYTDDETDSEIAGYIVYWMMFDECQILTLGVDISYRGIGVAQKLVRQAVQQAVAKNVKKVLLDVRKSNLAAIQLYQKLGFVIIHVRKSFYSNGEDAYQMALYADVAAPTEF